MCFSLFVPKLEGKGFHSYICPGMKESWERRALLKDQIRNWEYPCWKHLLWHYLWCFFYLLFVPSTGGKGKLFSFAHSPSFRRFVFNKSLSQLRPKMQGETPQAALGTAVSRNLSGCVEKGAVLWMREGWEMVHKGGRKAKAKNKTWEMSSVWEVPGEIFSK